MRSCACCHAASNAGHILQVIRDTTVRPFRCLDAHYRRELVRVYITNVESLCRRFIEERRDHISATIGGGSPFEAQQAFHSFWKRLGARRRSELLQARRCQPRRRA